MVVFCYLGVVDDCMSMRTSVVKIRISIAVVAAMSTST